MLPVVFLFFVCITDLFHIELNNYSSLFFSFLYVVCRRNKIIKRNFADYKLEERKDLQVSSEDALLVTIRKERNNNEEKRVMCQQRK